ncbi:tyrosine-type recombinase/integrase [Neptunomonas antarctica]|uniref:Site-specific recombinase XerD n=1 Tax=Neptunomonas antarctica TaxID=619304 RepID=A0A1N7J5R2_9GAMM|nr:tyrosine-type recombinase/integrase [Neptunomonas antarctica]SIS44703.1 Site-specific recombinase XerD [Neptunomonas antarctica]
MIKQKPNGKWLVDIEPVKGKRFRKTFDTKADCKRYETLILSKFTTNNEWVNPNSDKRSLVDIVDLWHQLHGHTLKDGFRRFNALIRLSNDLGNPVASRLTSSMFLMYRKQRINQGLKPKTLNNELIYIRAVFNELIALQQLNYVNPLEKVKPLKVPERELTWLNKDEINELFAAVSQRTGYNLNPHLFLLIEICLSTGARWSEAEGLNASLVKNNQVTFVDTKNGKARTVPISEDLANRLYKHWIEFGPFTSAIGSFRRVLDKTGMTLPEGQATHVLRHSFASHFVMNGGNIVTLQRILGHSSVKTTMRYAHLCPDFLNDAIKYNPMSEVRNME